MPAYHSEMTEGTVARWRVGIGDTLSDGMPIADIEVGVCVFGIEPWVVRLSATVLEILAEPGETVAVGAPMLRVEVPTGR